MGMLKSGNSVFAGGLLTAFQQTYALKSAEKKQQRRMECERQVDFWAKQKENLKEQESQDIDEIRQKIELLYSYNEEIKAAKARYNQEQKQHILDEAKEKGEKIAEAAEKQKPKTEEERKTEAEKEALGIEERENVLDEMLDKVQKREEEAKEMFLDKLLMEEEKQKEYAGKQEQMLEQETKI